MKVRLIQEEGCEGLIEFQERINSFCEEVEGINVTLTTSSHGDLIACITYTNGVPK